MDKEELALQENVHYNESGDLCVDNVPVASIAATHSTPTYVYSLQRVVNSYKGIHTAFSKVLPNVSVHYSLKANANVTLVKALLKEGCGIDCVSAGEVHRAIRCGCSPSDIVFAGVGKDVAELEYAIKNGVGWFNVENEFELQHLSRIALESNVKGVKAALRINPDVTADTHPNIATGHGGAKFGMVIDAVTDILRRVDEYPGISIEGVHLHIGSQLGDTKQTVEAVTKVTTAIAPFDFITAINMGGGFPAKYCGRKLPYPEDFAVAVAPLLQKYHVMLEPGRSIAGEAGVLLTRSLYRKDQGGQKMLIVDTSMTDNMRPALYDAKHALLPAKRCSTEAEVGQFTVVGPVCESTDVVAKNATLPLERAQPGELLVQLTAGAYCASMANTYNQRPLAPQIVVMENGELLVSRKRQTFEDLEREDLDW